MTNVSLLQVNNGIYYVYYSGYLDRLFLCKIKRNVQTKSSITYLGVL